MTSLFRQRLFIFFVPLLLALPFLNRAYFVDDSYFVEIASWLRSHPAEPYHFLADDAGLQNRGWEKNGFVRMVNPLAHHYYLALLMNLFGTQEWILRLGCTFLSCFSALFLFELARRWTNTPVVATLLILVTPAHWLTSYSLLIDGTMTFFAFGAIYFFIRSTENDNWLLILLSGLFMGLAILSKYPALFLVPLFCVWLVLRWGKMPRHWPFFIPMVMGLSLLLAYSLWTKSLYGRPHILAASARMVHVFGWPKLFSFFVFFSGSLLLPLVSWFTCSARMRVVAGTFVLAIMVLLASGFGGFSSMQSALLAAWLVTSVLFVGNFLMLRSRWVFPRDYFLAAWLLGFIAMMLIVMDWVAVRYYLLAAPAVVFIAVRLCEVKWAAAAPRVLHATLAVIFLFTSLLAYSDYKQAEPSRLLGPALKAKGFRGGERHFYLGDSFTMSYLRADGWIPCFPETVFRVGDLILAKEVTMPLVWFAKRPVILREAARFDYPSSLPLKVMDYAGSAGFYASVWGALPFTFSIGPWERFHLFEVVALKSDDSR